MTKISAEEAKKLIQKGIYSDTDELDKMTEEDIHEAAQSDPDAQPLSEEEAKEFRAATHRGKGVYAHEKKKDRK